MIHVLDVMAVQQDYAWFCVLLAWAFLGVLAWLRWAELRSSPARVCLCMLLVSGIVLAAAELAMHASPLPSVHDARLGWDRLMSGALAAQIAAMIPLLPAPNKRSRFMLLFTIPFLAVLWFLRPTMPLIANAGLSFAAVGLGLAVFFHWRKRVVEHLRARPLAFAGLITGLAQFTSTTGLLSELTTQQRRWAELSLLGVPSALLQLTLAIAVGMALDPLRVRTADSRASPVHSMHREFRLLSALFVAWLVLGFGIASWTGRAARQIFEKSLVDRARAAAALVNPTHVLPVVSPSFQLEPSPEMFQENGRRNPVALAPYLLQVYRATADDLARVEAVNPGIQWAHFLTFREGYVVSCVFSSKLKLRHDSVALHREINEADRRNWTEQRVFFEGPVIGPWGEQVRALAPVIHPQAGMLGWIALDYGAGDWNAALALARLQSFALTGAGAIILILVLAQRLLSYEQAADRERAALALAADRAKTAFLAKVSHELRTPVQSILGYGELLAGLSLPGLPARWLGSIRQQGQLLIRLVNDLLDLSAMQSGAFRLVSRPTNLAVLVRSCADSLRPRAASKGLALHCETDPALPSWLSLDADRVRQIVFNLLGNAIKFSDHGGVYVQVRRLRDAGSEFTARIELRVRDTGPGIPPEQQASLFRPFFRLREHADREGAGLGLALTAALCAGMGGKISVISDGMYGSEFVAELEFPFAQQPAATATLPSSPLDLTGRRVLIADDNALVRELYLTCLRSAGAWCETADDGLEAVERCLEEPFDVVVLDVSMPWLDGLESTRRIRSRGRPGLRIIGVSAHAGAAERQVGLAAGMDAFLVKPVPLAELVAAVAGCAAESPVLPSDKLADLVLLRRLRGKFAADVPRLLGELREAAQAGDRAWLAARAHHLKNSADVAGHPDVSLLCSRIQQLAGQEGTRAELIHTVEQVSALLREIIEHAFSSGEPDDPQKT